MYDFCELDFDVDGFPGEYVFGDDAYVPDEYADELWKSYNDCRDYYVSTYGRIWSNISHSFIHGTPTGESGHMDVSLRINGKRAHRYVHRMVAEMFIHNPNNDPMVRHLDDDPSNNRVDNLAWGTQTDNMRDAIDSNRFRFLSDADREKAMQKRRTPIIVTDTSTNKRYRFISQREAARCLGLSQPSIFDALNQKPYTLYGYYFEYAKEVC